MLPCLLSLLLSSPLLLLYHPQLLQLPHLPGLQLGQFAGLGLPPTSQPRGQHVGLVSHVLRGSRGYSLGALLDWTIAISIHATYNVLLTELCKCIKNLLLSIMSRREIVRFNCSNTAVLHLLCGITYEYLPLGMRQNVQSHLTSHKVQSYPEGLYWLSLLLCVIMQGNDTTLHSLPHYIQ